MIDPRTKNRIFSMESPTAYLKEYTENLTSTLAQIPASALDAAVDLLKTCLRDGQRIYVCGNGGSAAIADHLCCDWAKGSRIGREPTLKTHSLVANGALMTALANDYGYEETFSTQIDMYGEAGDVLVAISSSGNSPNIVKGVQMAQARGMKVLGLSGFAGGKLAELSDISLHANFPNYGLIEDCHQMLMHVLSQYLVKSLELKQ